MHFMLVIKTTNKKISIIALAVESNDHFASLIPMSGVIADKILLNSSGFRSSSLASKAFMCWRCVGMEKHDGQLSPITGNSVFRA